MAPNTSTHRKNRRQLLRVATAGSVDDGKSTLIGRLLYDSKSILQDQLDSIEQTSRERGDEHADLALLTDGLKAEREQGITIDVAYRYFATPKRNFIVADTPGHTQYTRNMVTGASTADLAIILIDARKGVLEQTRRHAFLSSLLGIPHLVVCVNKMDLVEWSEERFDDIRDDFVGFAAKLEFKDLTFVPVSALQGDNVVDVSKNTAWYRGSSLLQHLESVHIESDRNLIDARLPVQYVIRPQRSDGNDHRSYAGTVAGGVLRVNDEVVVLPGGHTSTVKTIWDPSGNTIESAFSPMAITLALNDDIDISRGEMLARPNNRPFVANLLDAMICWFSEDTELREGNDYLLQSTTQESRASVHAIQYTLDVNTLHRDKESEIVSLNQIARLSIKTQQPLMFDAYRRNRHTGSFILIDRATNKTVAAGMINGPVTQQSNVVWHSTAVERDQRTHQGATLWLTGLSASGKSLVGTELEKMLVREGRQAYLMDGDNIRHGLNSDLGFTDGDRRENMRRIAEVAALFADSGSIAIVSAISPFAAERQLAKEIHLKKELPFVEIFVDTPLETCEARDPKGLYKRARLGEITNFTGISSPYERPQEPDVTVTPDDGEPSDAAQKIRSKLWL